MQSLSAARLMRCNVQRHSLARCEIPCRIVSCQNEYCAESRAVRQTSTSPPVITSNCGECAVHLCCGSSCRAGLRAAQRSTSDAGHRAVPRITVQCDVHQCCRSTGVVVDLAVDSSMQARQLTVLQSDSSARVAPK